MLNKILGWFVSLASFVWNCMNAAVDFATLPEGLEEFWRENLMGAPAIPAILLVVGLLILAWVYFPSWRRFIHKVDSPTMDRSINFPNLANVNAPFFANTGTINARPQRVMSDELRKSLLEKLDKSAPTMISHVSGEEPSILANEIRDFLEQNRYEIRATMQSFTHYSGLSFFAAVDPIGGPQNEVRVGYMQ